MDPWRINLQVGDWIIWQDEAVEMDGQPALVSQGMKGRVLSLHDGFHLDVIQGGSVPPKAILEFENGMRLMVDKRMMSGSGP